MPKLEDFLNNTNASLVIIRDLIIRDAKKTYPKAVGLAVIMQVIT